MRDTVIKWVVVALLVALAALATGLVNRDVYTKAEVDTRIEHVEDIEQTHYDQLHEQSIRVETKVDKLVDHLIKEGIDAD